MLNSKNGFVPEVRFFNSHSRWNVIWKIFSVLPSNNQTILGDWALQQPEENVTTVYEGIKSLGEEKGHTVDFFDSNWDIREISEQDIANTVAYAANYDTIVAVIGDNSRRYLGAQRNACGDAGARSAVEPAGTQRRPA